MPDVHTRKHTIALVFLFFFTIVVGGGVLLGTMMWMRMGDPYKGYTTGETFVDIPQGSGVAEIRRRLVEAGVVQDEYTFRAALWWSGQARSLQAGEYRFAEPISPLEVIRRLARGDIYTRRITIPEGLTIDEMAKLVESRGFGSATDFVAAAGDASRIKDLDPQANDLEGYLFPETYALPRNAGAARLVGMMVDRFRAIYTEEMQQRAAAQGLTTRQVMTLASLVEKETGKPEERPLVAAVYRNRLKIGMGMQADPTVVYALQKAGRYDGNIRRADLQFDSPYNTYRYAGLPPGPIAAPGKAAIEAALAPADVPYIYFVSRNDGSHVFAETLAQHNANVYEHQVLYFRKLRQARP